MSIIYLLTFFALRMMWLSLRWWAADVNESAASYYEACVRPGGHDVASK